MAFGVDMYMSTIGKIYVGIMAGKELDCLV